MKKIITLTAAALITVALAPTAFAQDQINPGPTPYCKQTANKGCYWFYLDEDKLIQDTFLGDKVQKFAADNLLEEVNGSTLMRAGEYFVKDDSS